MVSSAEAARYEFGPAVQTSNACHGKVDLYIDSTGEQANAADIEISYDASKITILDSVTNKFGVQITPGIAFSQYWGNEVDNTAGKMLLAGGNFPVPEILTSRKLFATIEFFSKMNQGDTTQFRIRFDGVGNTVDSNIANAQNGNDLLTSVGNLDYISSSNCDENGNVILPSPSVTPSQDRHSGANDEVVGIIASPTPSDVQNKISTTPSQAIPTSSIFQKSDNEDGLIIETGLKRFCDLIPGGGQNGPKWNDSNSSLDMKNACFSALEEMGKGGLIGGEGQGNSFVYCCCCINLLILLLLLILLFRKRYIKDKYYPEDISKKNKKISRK